MGMSSPPKTVVKTTIKTTIKTTMVVEKKEEKGLKFWHMPL